MSFFASRLRPPRRGSLLLRAGSRWCDLDAGPLELHAGSYRSRWRGRDSRHNDSGTARLDQLDADQIRAALGAAVGCWRVRAGQRLDWLSPGNVGGSARDRSACHWESGRSSRGPARGHGLSAGNGSSDRGDGPGARAGGAAGGFDRPELLQHVNLADYDKADRFISSSYRAGSSIWMGVLGRTLRGGRRFDDPGCTGRVGVGGTRAIPEQPGLFGGVCDTRCSHGICNLSAKDAGDGSVGGAPRTSCGQDSDCLLQPHILAHDYCELRADACDRCRRLPSDDRQ